MTIHNLTVTGIEYHRAQVLQLKADSQPLWGKLDSTRMMRHLRAMIQLSLGEMPNREKAFVPRWVGDLLGWFFFDVFTRWPQFRSGKNPLPEVFPTPEHSFEEEKGLLLDAMNRFAHRCEAHPDETQLSPLLGQIPLTRWARVHGVHQQHHFRQFGLVS